MATWHPTIAAYELFDQRRESLDDKNPSITTVLQVSTTDDDHLGFATDLILNRELYPLFCPFVLRATRCDIVQDRGKYTADASDETLTADNSAFVSVTYTSDNRIETSFYGQCVLWEERWSPVTEFITIEYNKFAWADSGETAWSPDESPVYLLKYFNVDVTVSRVIIEDIVGSGSDCLFKTLVGLSGKVNDKEMMLPGLSCVSFGTEQVLFSFDDMIRTVELSDGTIYRDLKLKFSIKPDFGWNKFFRPNTLVDGSGGCNADNSGFFSLRYKRTADCGDTPLFKPYQKVSFDDMFVPVLGCEEEEEPE